MQYHKIVLAGLACAALGGCAVPQNTLLFATNTTVALDVSVNPTNGTPNITIGYKRQEGVLMPLMASKNVYPQGAFAGGNPVPAAVPGGPDHGPGDALLCPEGKGGKEGHDPCVFRGTDGLDTDTYSVLATIGANVEGTIPGANGGSGGTVGIKQVFATGIASRILAASGGAALVNTNAPPPSALSADALKEYTALKTVKDKKITTIQTALDATPGPYETNRDKLVDAHYASDPDTANYLKKLSEPDFMKFMNDNPGIADTLAAAN